MTGKNLAFFGGVFAMVIAAIAWPAWHGSPLTWVAFNLAFIAMMALVLVGPVSYVYGFLSTFLFLGFWGKLQFHLVFSGQFIEPIGQFDGSVMSWEAVVLAVTCATGAIALARVGQIVVCKGPPIALQQLQIPAVYIRFRRPLWLASLVLLLLVHAWNLQVSFYQIGVIPRLVLPLHLNVLTAWLISWGFAFILAALAYWELSISKKHAVLVIAILLLGGVISGISTLSRSAYLFQGFAFCIGWWVMNFERTRMNRFLILSGFFCVGLAISLVTVQVQRAEKYLVRTPIAESTTLNSSDSKSDAKESDIFVEQKRVDVQHFLKQLPYLFLNRWVGLEGVMAVFAYPDKGMAKFVQVVSESPRLGVSSSFQRVANAKYSESEQFTFLTLAGPVALLLFSGSLLLVALGMLLITGLLLFVEMAIRRGIGNPFVQCLAGVAMAYTLSQATFPYLTLVFFVELLMTCVFIWFLQRMSRS